jgi:histidinol-phosphatase
MPGLGQRPSMWEAPRTASEEELERAVEIAKEAGSLSLEWFSSKGLEASTKPDGTPVTRADVEVERLLRSRLAESFPHDGILGEEAGISSQGQSGRNWIVDPIDGTKAFMRGVPLYSVLVALVENGEATLGVIHMPALGQTCWAGKGLGCFYEGARATVSRTSSLSDALVTTSGYEDWDPAFLGQVGASGAMLRTWGDGYGWTLVATGRADVMADFGVSVWDLGPAPVIIKEAGGRISDPRGNDIELSLALGSRFDAIATNGQLHEGLLGLVDQSRPDQ